MLKSHSYNNNERKKNIKKKMHSPGREPTCILRIDRPPSEPLRHGHRCKSPLKFLQDITKKRNQLDFAKSTLLDEISLQKQIFGPHALFLFTL